MWHLAHALGKDGHEVTLFAAPGSDPALPAEFLEVPSFEVGELARSDVSMPPADGFLGDHHAYLSLILDLAGAVGRRLRGRAQPQPAVPADRDGPHVAPPAAVHSAHAADALARIGDAAPSGCPGTFVAVSRPTAAACEHATPGPVAVVPNGVDLGAWPVGPDGDDLIWFGRIVPEKGAHLAIEAARRAGYRLRIAGPISNREYFSEHVEPFLDPT